MSFQFFRSHKPCIWKGALAGAIGGLAGSVAKAAGEKVYPPRTAGQTPPPVVLIRKATDGKASRSAETAGMQVIHFAFGAVLGAAYGAIAEHMPKITVGQGAAFGLGLNVLTHESALPALKLADSPTKQTAREHLSETATHTIYGVATELTRSLVRKQL